MKSGEARKLASEYSTAYWAEVICTRCGGPYVLGNRSDYTDRLRIGIPKHWKCSDCLEIERGEELERHKHTFEERRSYLQRQYNLAHREQRSALSLSLEDAVYLLAMVRQGASEDFKIIAPIETFREPLTPAKGRDHEVAVHLIAGSILVPHPESSPNAFVWEGPSAGNIYTLKTSWGWPLGDDGIPMQDVVSELEALFRNSQWLEPWRDQWLTLWKKIAQQECLEYLLLAMKDHHFDFHPGEKTFSVLSELLEVYSVGQVWRIIWNATTNAVAYRERSGIPRAQAANSVVGGMQRYGENARAQGWKLEPFRRERRCPQSVISQVFFNVVVQLGGDYLGVTADASLESAIVP